jgi:hypothetical protein
VERTCVSSLLALFRLHRNTRGIAYSSSALPSTFDHEMAVCPLCLSRASKYYCQSQKARLVYISHTCYVHVCGSYILLVSPLLRLSPPPLPPAGLTRHLCTTPRRTQGVRTRERERVRASERVRGGEYAPVFAPYKRQNIVLVAALANF